MTALKARDLSELSEEELAGTEADLKGELFRLRFQAATGQLDNPMRIRDVRRDIARVKTVLRLRELAAGGEAR